VDLVARLLNYFRGKRKKKKGGGGKGGGDKVVIIIDFLRNYVGRRGEGGVRKGKNRRCVPIRKRKERRKEKKRKAWDFWGYLIPAPLLWLLWKREQGGKKGGGGGGGGRGKTTSTFVITSMYFPCRKEKKRGKGTLVCQVGRMIRVHLKNFLLLAYGKKNGGGKGRQDNLGGKSTRAKTEGWSV